MVAIEIFHVDRITGREEPGLVFRLRRDFPPEKAAEYAFHLTSAPRENLTEAQADFLDAVGFNGPGMMPGDLVRVSYPDSETGVLHVLKCKSMGWEEVGGAYGYTAPPSTPRKRVVIS